MQHVILLSGHTGNGKSSLAKKLRDKYGFALFKTSDHIAEEAKKRSLDIDRQALKDLGDELDIETGHKWVISKIAEFIGNLDHSVPTVVDCIRKREQLELFRQQVDFKVTHVHLFARQETLQKRMHNKLKSRGIDDTSADALAELDLIKSEDDIANFKKDADIRIFTDRTDTDDNIVRVAAYLGLYPPPELQCVDVLIGGQYGSEGKGQIAAYLSQEYDVLMRVGGPNAGHTVAREQGKYTYHSLPSGCKESIADIVIGPGATVHIEELLNEIKECSVPPDRIFIDPQVMVITDADRDAEAAMAGAIGSTKRGGGSASSRRIMERLDEKNRAKLAKDYEALSPYVRSSHDRLQKAFLNAENVFLEGTQGSALSIFHGPYPHVTSRDTNVSGCLAEAGIPPRRIRKIILVIRYTPIRVQSPKDGDSGLLKHETDFQTIKEEAKLKENLEENELTSTTKRKRRVGWFEWDSFKRACELNSPTDICLTFADYHKASNRDARRFEQLDTDTIKFIEELERVAQAPVSIINTRFPHDEDKPTDLRTLIDRRNWRKHPPVNPS